MQTHYIVFRSWLLSCLFPDVLHNFLMVLFCAFSSRLHFQICLGSFSWSCFVFLFCFSSLFSVFAFFFCLIALFSCFKLILSPHSIVSLFCFILLMIVPFFMWSFSSLFVLVVFSCVPTCYRCPHYLVCVYFVFPLSCHPSLLCVTFPHVL